MVAKLESLRHPIVRLSILLGEYINLGRWLQSEALFQDINALSRFPLAR